MELYNRVCDTILFCMFSGYLWDVITTYTVCYLIGGAFPIAFAITNIIHCVVNYKFNTGNVEKVLKCENEAKN